MEGHRHIERRELNPEDYDLPDGLATGVFSNLAIVQQSGPGRGVEEITLDFLYTGRGLKRPKVVARVIMTPGHAVRLLNALRSNLERIDGLEPPTD